MADVTIYSEAFCKLRDDFNKMIEATLTKMKQKDSSDASLTLKLDIEIEKTFEPMELPDGTQTMRDVDQVRGQRQVRRRVRADMGSGRTAASARSDWSDEARNRVQQGGR